VNRRDGLPDLVVGVDATDPPGFSKPGGSFLLVFEGSTGALRAASDAIALPAPATALAIGPLDEHYAMDVAAACGEALVVVHGRDRTLTSAGQGVGGESLSALTVHSFPYTISALALGDFIPGPDNRLELALLTADGVIRFLAPTNAVEVAQLPVLEPGTWNLQPATWNLQPANVSSLPGDALAVLDAEHKQIHLVVTVAYYTRLDGAPLSLQPWSVALDAAGGPAAVLPMRLNPDALDDLVVLQDGAAAPLVLRTAPLATLTVNETGDQGDTCAAGDGICAATQLQGDPPTCVVVAGCTLRAAVDEAGGVSGMDYIDFNIPGTGPHTIQLGSYLWVAVTPATIDATTQPGYAGTPLVEITGAPTLTLLISEGSSVVRGLSVTGAGQHGIQIDDFLGWNDGNTIVEGNWIGVAPTGQCRGNGELGVAVWDVAGNTIGGTTSAARNVISCNWGHGVQIGESMAATGNKVLNNLIGTDTAGSPQQGWGNGGSGVALVDAPNNDVGGSAEGEGNLIADNRNGVGAGVIIGYGSAAGNLVAGNWIGVHDDGGPLGNWSDGVGIVLGAHDNNIGGTAGVAPAGPCQGACNLIAGNARNGVYMGPFAVQEVPAPGRVAGVLLRPDPTGQVAVSPAQATGNLVRGNFIGTEEWGTVKQANWRHGVFLDGAANNTIGGLTAQDRNLISGSDWSGVCLSGSGATGNKVQGNLIGTDAAGTADLGNALEGVSIENGASNNSIGGTEQGAGNTIAFSGRNGVLVLDGVGNPILGNSIFSNGLLGIDLGNDGITANDPGDGDGGPNNRQNFSLFTNLAPDGNNLITTGILSSTPGTRFRLEFFTTPEYEPGGAMEGRTLLGSTEVTVGGAGYGEFSLALPCTDRSLGVTASATRLDGSGQPVETSEFTPVDVAVVGVEVTQVIQDLSNSVELVTKKPTYALVHARVFGPPKVSDIRAQLTGWRGGTPLGTIVAQPESVDLVRVPSRRQYEASFHFRLPFEWTDSGQLRVEAEINYPPPAFTEADYANNKETALIPFSTEPTLRVHFYRVAWYELPSGPWHTARPETVRGIESTLNSIYPAPYFYGEYHKIARYGLSPIDALACLEVNTNLAEARAWDRLWGAVDADVVYLGIVPLVTGGLASPLVYVASVGEDGSSEWVNKNGAHEIGHVFGRAHTCTPGGDESWCDDSYPYPQGNLSVTPTGGPMSEYAPTIAYGFDRMAENPIHDNFVSDLMSYGTPTRWMSDYTWNGIRVFRARLMAQELPRLQPAGEYLFVSGRISLTQNVAVLSTFYRIPDLPAQPAPISGTCTLRLLDAGGGELAAYYFAAPSNPHIPPEDEPQAWFVEVVPYVTGTARIEVVSGTQLLAARLVSSGTPTVTFEYPLGGECLTGTVPISWTATDGDGGPLTSALFYSADDGQTWNALATEWPSTTFPLDTVALPGSGQARLRVLVSDGVNTGQATTLPFTVELKPPQTAITLPADGQIYAPGDPVTLIGAAWDQEDGTLTGTALLWSDSVSGTVGSGEELVIPQLAEGRHTITLTATDSDGMTGTTSVHIRVGYYQVVLPLVLRDWPAAMWHPEAVDAPRTIEDLRPRSLALDAAGRPHAVYGGDHLYHAWDDGSGWQSEVVDPASSVGRYAALAFDSAGRPHIAYKEDDVGCLKYARWDGAAWQIEWVDCYANAVGSYLSMALDGSDRPHISYHDYAYDALKHAYWDGTVWQVTTIETAQSGYSNMIGVHNSTVVDNLGRPHVLYSDAGWGALPYRFKHATWDGTQWQIEVVESVNCCYKNSADLDSAGRIHVVYQTYDDSNTPVLKHAVWDGSTWQFATILAMVNYTPDGLSMALDGADRVHVTYYHRTGSAGMEVRHLYWDGAAWQSFTVEDVTGKIDFDEVSSVAVDGSGQVHVLYPLDKAGLLKYARWDGAAWQIALVDEWGDPGGGSSLVLDSSGRPRIGYVDNQRYEFRYAAWDGSAWQIQVVDRADWMLSDDKVSLALDPVSDYPRLAYESSGVLPNPAGLYYAAWDGGQWQLTQVDADGEAPSLVLDGAGRPQIAYRGGGGELRLARWDGAQWVRSTLESTGSGWYISLRLDSQGRAHIAYDTSTLDVRYAHWDGATWQFETVTTAGDTWGVSLALDSLDRPHIAYHDQAARDLLYAYWDEAAWQITNVDSTHQVGVWPSLALDGSDYPHIAYYDLDYDSLKYAHWDGTQWLVETAETGGNVGGFPSLALDGSGRPHISHYDWNMKDLRYTWWGR